jgi:hypothetical protein
MSDSVPGAEARRPYRLARETSRVQQARTAAPHEIVDRVVAQRSGFIADDIYKQLRRQADAPHKILEALIGAQAVERGISA